MHQRLAIEDAAIDRGDGGNNLAIAAEQIVAEFEYAQIGPGARTKLRDGVEHLARRPIRPRLRQDQRRRGGRARHAGVTMNQQMAARHVAQLMAEGEQPLDIGLAWREPVRLRLDYVVKAQRQPAVRRKCRKSRRIGRIGVEN